MMKKLFWILFIIVVLGYGGYFSLIEFIARQNNEPAAGPAVVPGVEEIVDVIDGVEDVVSEVTTQSPLPEKTVVAENLTIPWDIVFLSNTDLLVAERAGTVVRINTETGVVTNIDIPDVVHRGEGGLLGMVKHPQFETNQWVYLYRTSNLESAANVSINEVVRYTFVDNAFTDETVIVADIPGSLFHNGGRIAFGPDGFLYIATGDARDPDISQDLTSLAGKILRVTNTGDVPLGNPFGNEIYAYGHRNTQGLTWDGNNQLWTTDHGRTTATLTGMDEVNRVTVGGNYGWPESEGDTVLPNTIGPALHSGPSVTWAPGGATYYDGSIFFGGLKGQRLYEAILNPAETEVIKLEEHFVGEYGRIRTTRLGPDGGLYIMTSNRDGRGVVNEGDDVIVRLNPRQFR